MTGYLSPHNMTNGELFEELMRVLDGVPSNQNSYLMLSRQAQQADWGVDMVGADMVTATTACDAIKQVLTKYHKLRQKQACSDVKHVIQQLKSSVDELARVLDAAVNDKQKD